MIRCRVCEADKPDSDYERTPAGNPRKICKACQYKQRIERISSNPEKYYRQRRAVLIRHKYGMEPDEYEAMLEKQGGACAICRRVVDSLLCVDHCHDSLKIRGLLCKNCNTGLGMFQDRTHWLKNAIEYLERGESN